MIEAWNNRLQLRLDWDDWAAEVVSLTAPAKLEGRVRNGKFTLQRAGGLTRVVSGTTWILKDGKTFTLHPDGTTSASWHVHKGFWHIIGKYEVEMTISWRPKNPERVTVGANGETLRWSDEDFGGIAKRVRRPEPIAEDR